MKKLLLISPILLIFSCYNKIPDADYRLINWDGQTDYLPEQYFTFKGNEFGAYIIDDHGEHRDEIEYGAKKIEYEVNNVFTFKRNDTIFSWKYFLNKDTLTMKSQNYDMYIICLKTK